MANQQGKATLSTDLLKAQIAILEKELASKNVAIKAKEDIIIAKESTINKLTGDLNAAQFNNEQLRRMIFGSKRERFVSNMDINQLSIDFEPQTAEIEESIKAELETIRVEYQRKRTKKKHQGRLALPDHLPVVEKVIEPNEDITNMVCIGKEVTDELDYTPAKLHVNRIVRPKYISKEDEKGNQKQVIAELNRPLHKCIASAALLSNIYTDKFVYHLPFYRILKRFKQLGLSIPSSTLESWVKLGSRLLRPLYEVHRLYVFSEIYQMIDESPIKVQDKDKPGACHQGYMWVRYGPLSQSVLFEYYEGRSSKKPIADLSTFKGYIQTDGYSGYTYLASTKDIIHLSCWAHARRYFDKALSNDQERASHVMKLIQTLYNIEAFARESAMSHDERHQLRLEKSLPIINAIGQYIYDNKSKVTPKSPIGKAFEYCSNRWISLQNYLEHGMLEIDSNLVENSIRPLALGRKNYLFAGSHDAAKDIAMFYSFVGTCAKNDIDPQSWITYVIENINTTKKSEYKNLLPQFIDKKLLNQ